MGPSFHLELQWGSRGLGPFSFPPFFSLSFVFFLRPQRTAHEQSAEVAGLFPPLSLFLPPHRRNKEDMRFTFFLSFVFSFFFFPPLLFSFFFFFSRIPSFYKGRDVSLAGPQSFFSPPLFWLFFFSLFSSFSLRHSEEDKGSSGGLAHFSSPPHLTLSFMGRRTPGVKKLPLLFLSPLSILLSFPLPGWLLRIDVQKTAVVPLSLLFLGFPFPPLSGMRWKRCGPPLPFFFPEILPARELNFPPLFP